MEQQFEQKIDKELGRKNLGRLLLQYSMPAIIATAATSIYNIVDRIFIGQMVGPLAISGLTIAMPIMNILSAFGTLIGSGAASIVSIRMGENRHNDALSVLANAVLINLIIGFVFSALGLFFLDDILYLFGASNDTFCYAHDFMYVIILGLPVTQMFFGLNPIMRASGYPLRSMEIVLATMFVNLFLVYLLIFKWQWGVSGAACATIVAQMVGLIFVLIHFFNKHSRLNFNISAFRLKIDIIKDICSIGMSPFLIRFCSCIVIVFINWQLRKYSGDIAVGVFGVINIIANFIIVIVLGLSQGMQPIVGFNYGAKYYDRVFFVLRKTIFIGMLITTIGFFLIMKFPSEIAGWFTIDVNMKLMIIEGLKLYMLMIPLLGIQIVASNFFQAIGKAKISIFLSMSRQVLFLIPFLIFLPYCYGLNGIWLATPVADFLSTVVTIVWLLIYYKKYKSINRNYENTSTN